MARLTLEAGTTPCPWSAIDKLLTALFLDLHLVDQGSDIRVYQLNFPEPQHPIPLLKELQARLDHEDVHFFVDLKP